MYKQVMIGNVKVGDIVFYNSCGESKRYCKVTEINTDEVWGYWTNILKDIDKTSSCKGLMFIYDSDYWKNDRDKAQPLYFYKKQLKIVNINGENYV